jgi:putative phosphoribosyl transferase
MKFKNRQEAGKKLSQELEQYKGEPAVVYALPRGGVPVGYEVARSLGVPLDLVIARKVGHPFQPEFAVCAVTEREFVLCNQSITEYLDEKWLEQAIVDERAEAARRREVYLKGRELYSPQGKTAIIARILSNQVDGLATLHIPQYFGAVGLYYEEFEQTSDQEVIELLESVST